MMRQKIMIHRFSLRFIRRYHGQVEALAPIDYSSVEEVVDCTEEQPLLSQEQSSLLQKMLSGENIYFTGTRRVTRFME
jgi:hypothetical protein